MRADDILTDLEAAAEARLRAEQWHEVADTVRVENAAVALHERACAALGRGTIAYVRGTPIRGTIIAVSRQWIAIDPESARVADTTSDLVRRGVRVIDWSALEALSLDNALHQKDDEPEIGRTWNAVFRACAKARTNVVWHARSGHTYCGVLGAVGADHVIMSSTGTHIALMTSNLAMLEPFAGRPEGRDFQKSSRIRPA